MKKSLGDILVSAGVITHEQLQEGNAECAKTGQSLEKYLIEQKQISAEAIASAYATYAGLPLINKITEEMADVALLAKVPLKFLRENDVMPIRIDGNITILTANPMIFQPIDELNMLLTNGTARAVVAPYPLIIDAINRYYPLEGAKQVIAELEEEEPSEEVEFTDIEEKDILAMASEAPIIKLVNHILFQAVKRGASDIHIEPFEKELAVRYRIDGVMYQIMTPPKRVQGALASRIKIMAHLNIAEKRVPQDGRIDLKVAGKPYDIRVSILPVAFGERIVMRLLDKSRTFADLKELGLGDRDFELVMKNIVRPNGIIYVTGPTGSGKTTTLYSILSRLNQPDVNIITVEDPVEYQVQGIGQVHVRDKIGLTFAAALRSILRQDPDVIMIGETRDAETAQIAIQASLTGHLVLSSLHTNSAPATITRLLDMGVEPYLIASSVVLAIAQRLVRKLCPICKQQYKPMADILKSVGVSQAQANKIHFFKAVGCDECLHTGYRGRLPIFEVMEMTKGIERLTMERADTSQIRRQAIADGMTPLVADGLRKAEAGLTTLDEVLSVAVLEEETVEA